MICSYAGLFTFLAIMAKNKKTACGGIFGMSNCSQRMHWTSNQFQNASNVPDEQKCKELMQRYNMLPHIVEHSYRVCQIAVFLASTLYRNGTHVNIALVRAGSLLHDITKTQSLVTNEPHAQSGRELLRALGYPEVAEIVGSHVTTEEGDVRLPISEADIVNYADKRVLHVRVVSLEERFKDLKDRYGKTPEALNRLEAMERAVTKLEKRIFSILAFNPEFLTAFNHLSPYASPDSLMTIPDLTDQARPTRK